MHSSSQRGFTLIEVMVVIVVMGIVASLILLNLNATDHRKTLQAREILLLDIEKIFREANDQSRVLALKTFTANDVSNFHYQVVEYQPLRSGILRTQVWQPYSDFKTQTLPEQVSFRIESADHQFVTAKNTELLQADTPQLIFLGNGEVKPVRIQFYWRDQPVGDALQLDHLGRIDAS
jgi:general secretion pathway protein G